MRRLAGSLWRSIVLVVGGSLAAAGMAAPPVNGAAALTVTVGTIKPGGVIPPAYANCVPAPQGHTTRGLDKSPAISWSKGPGETRSYAIIMVDPDVPTVFDDADKEGKTLPASLKRRDFYHWILVDIPATVTALPEGADSREPSPRRPGPTANGVRGVNDYSGGGTVFGGYNGPCPPWNDAIPHHYHFAVYALDVPHLGVSGNFTGRDALKAMQGHILAKGELVGVYSLNPDVAKTLEK